MSFNKFRPFAVGCTLAVLMSVAPLVMPIGKRDSVAIVSTSCLLTAALNWSQNA